MNRSTFGVRLNNPAFSSSVFSASFVTCKEGISIFGGGSSSVGGWSFRGEDQPDNLNRLTGDANISFHHGPFLSDGGGLYDSRLPSPVPALSHADEKKRKLSLIWISVPSCTGAPIGQGVSSSFFV